MKKAKFGTDFQNNRANYWLYEKYSFDLHPEISKNPDKLLWPEITDVAKTDCRNLHEPAITAGGSLLSAGCRTDVRLPAG